MSIPLLNIPSYEVELPLSKKKVKYRPFLIKEEKILLLAVEDGEESTITMAVQQVIDNCTFNKLDVKKLPTADIDYLFVKIREKSVGESIDIYFTCTSCKESSLTAIQLSDLAVVGAGKEKNIVLDDHCLVTMKYPTMDSTKEITLQSTLIDTTKLVASCIDMITIDDMVYSSEDKTFKEIEEWLDTLQDPQFNKLSEWVQELPVITYRRHLKCPKCGADNEIVLEGLDSFFG